MTSKLSSNPSSALHIYLHDFKLTFKQNLAVPILGLIVFILLIPVSTAGIPQSSIFNIEYTHQQILFQFFNKDINFLINAVTIFYGIIVGLALFRFMLVNKSANAYFSLGITRKKLFFIRYAIGLVMLLTAIVIPFIISLILNLTALGNSPSLVPCFIHVTLGFFALSLISFSTTILVCALVGTLTESAAYTTIILSTPTLILFSFNALAKHLLLGNAFGAVPSTGNTEIAPNFVSLLSYYNPILFFYKDSASFSLNYVRTDGTLLPPINHWLIVGWIIAAAVLALFGMYILEKRKAEITGVSGQSLILNNILTFVLPFFGFALVLDLAAAINLTAAMIIAAVTFAVLYAIFNLIATRSLWKKFYRFPLYLGTIFIVITICLTGGFGYNLRIPSPAQITEAEMTYVGSPNYLGSQIGGTSDGKGYYLTSSYHFSSEKDLEIVTSLHKEIIASGKESLSVKDKFSDTTIPYDITIKYTLKNGSTMIRYYDRTTFSTLAAMLDLENTDTVQNKMQETVLGTGNDLYWAPGAYKYGSIYLSNNWYTNPQMLQLGSEKRKEFLQCISKDIASQSLEDRYFPNRPPLGIIMFTQSDGSSSLNFAYNLENALVFVTSGFRNTLNFLKEYHLEQCFEFTGEIESITLQKYNPFNGISRSYKPMSQYFIAYRETTNHRFIGENKDFGKDYVVKDANKIAEVASFLRNDYFMSDGGYLAAVKIKGTNQYVYKFLPYTDAPQYIKAAIK